MSTIKIIIERTDDLYTAYAENVEGVYAAGETVQEVKQSVLDSIRLLKECNNPENIPEVLKNDYEIIYKFDVQSLLNYFDKVFTKAAFERLTGINQRQIQHYFSGLKKPRQNQAKKIDCLT